MDGVKGSWSSVLKAAARLTSASRLSTSKTTEISLSFVEIFLDNVFFFMRKTFLLQSGWHSDRSQREYVPVNAVSV